MNVSLCIALQPVDQIGFPLGYITRTGSQTLSLFEHLALGKSSEVGIKSPSLSLLIKKNQWQRYVKKRQHIPEPRVKISFSLLKFRL